MSEPAARRNPWVALAVLCLGNFLILLDTSIVNTAAPQIMRDLDTGIDEILWVLNAYLLALASLLIVAGRLGDLLGPRRVFVAGLAGFAVASLLCGAARTPGELIAARAVQGVAAATLLPQALVLISAIFPPARRGAAFGIFTAVAGLAAVSGPTLGGLLLTDLGWRWIFLINIPLGVAGVVATLRLVPDLRSPRPSGFDPVGVLLATAGLVAVAYALVEGERLSWGPAIGAVTVPMILVAGVVMLLVFVGWERRHRAPLVPTRLFGDRTFTAAVVITMSTSFALYGFLLVFVIETQTLLGMSPLLAGVTALPWTLTLSAVAPVAGRLTDRVGGRLLLMVGLAAFAAGVFAVAVVPGTDATPATFVLPLMLVGVGMGAAIAPTTTEAMRAVPQVLGGAASGVLNTARQVGGVLGAAVAGALLQHRLVDGLHASVTARAEQLPPELRPAFVDGFERAAAHGLNLGAGQHGGVSPPPGLAAGPAQRFSTAAADAFADAFLPAARATLTLVAVVLLCAAVLAAFVRRRATVAQPPAVVPPVAVSTAGASTRDQRDRRRPAPHRHVRTSEGAAGTGPVPRS
ncbi:DHA2 family efflux MFS transporter permease subunit [Micromonospora profundi]|uniref:DHA2 family efflux MFS transporter permease subunit n=1 Tax=Micromonospora TaxID=1873 RepID=UPI0033B2D69E